MRIKSLLAAAAAVSFVSAPVMANPASSLSVVKASTPAAKSSKLAGTPGGIPFVAIAAGVAFLVGLVIVTADGLDDDKSDSN
ncbi:hypothetical protein [Sphingomonas sp. 3-13AW]|jgi:hypothetical protein|uniref:hypothetical protein n=1 Tax=Sphingomonas sp. 3-13AW TaxID=3050450 RepID=UPI003BB5B9B2